MSVRVRRDASGARSIVSGWDGVRTAPFAMLLPVMIVALGWPGLVFEAAGLLATALTTACAGLLAFGVGFHVTIDDRGVHLVKHWLGVPFRRLSISHDHHPRPDAWWPPESKRPEGVVLIGLSTPGLDDRVLFGTKAGTREIERALRDEIAAVQAALAARTTT